MQLVATKTFTYNGRSLKPDDTFDAVEKDAQLLKLIGSAKDVSPPSKRKYHRRDMTAKAE